MFQKPIQKEVTDLGSRIFTRNGKKANSRSNLYL